MNTHVDRETFLANRKKGIGGSDVAAILGLSKYKSPYQLWLSKTNRDNGDDEQSEPAYWGNQLEDIVAKEFAKRQGVKIQRVNQQIIHPEFNWMIANIDRAVINPEISGNVRFKDGRLTTDQLLECKTANQYLAKLWGDEYTEAVPDYYLTQCQWYMGVTRTELCSLAVLIGGQKFRTYQIKFDEELFAMLRAECSAFWHSNVLADVPPPPSTFDDVLHRWSKHNPDTSIKADNELLGLVDEYQDWQKDVKGAEKHLEQLKVAICTRLADKEMIIDGDKRIATFKYQERITLDSKALKAAHPEIWQQFVKTSSTRVLRIS
ncbi:YqaJ viral recombinase family nuclease [Acinetobacter ursingii]|uniref:YqaJ viral recombinase family nuclease n=1 Tax=Acinetobacter ursingii TaxID=108980 RepID=UPI00124D9C82|nr:YqaJ viral recombinase family protein [Acinetobacter ursingii]